MDEMKEEIVFLEAELLDDDDDAPVGTLVGVEPQEEPAEEPAPQEEAPQEPVAEEPAEPVEEPVNEEPAPEEAVEEEPAADVEPVAEEPAEEPAPVEEPVEEEPAPIEEPVEEEPVAQEEVAEEPAQEPAPQEEPVGEGPVKEEPKPAPKPRKAPAKKAEPKAEEPAKAPKRAATSISLDDHDVNSALSDSDFEVKQSKPATIVKSKKVKEDDVWQVAPVANKEKKEEPKAEEPKKAPAKKAAPKVTPKAEEPVKEEAKPAPKKAPAKKAEPKAEEPKKAPAKKAEPKETPKQNTKSTEEKKMAAKEAKPAPAPKKADDKNQEKVLVEGTGDPKTRARFVIKVTDNGNYVYKLFASNKRVIAIGAQPYPALPSCKTGIQSVIKNSGSCPIEDQTLQKPVEQKCPKWVIYLDKKGEFRLRLIASNGNIVATTNDGYLSKAAAKQGIDAIARASQNADIVRNDNLW